MGRKHINSTPKQWPAHKFETGQMVRERGYSATYMIVGLEVHHDFDGVPYWEYILNDEDDSIEESRLELAPEWPKPEFQIGETVREKQHSATYLIVGMGIAEDFDGKPYWEYIFNGEDDSIEESRLELAP